MKEKESLFILENFKIEELEPRLEMSQWSAFAKSEQNWDTGATEVRAGARLTF